MHALRHCASSSGNRLNIGNSILCSHARSNVHKYVRNQVFPLGRLPAWSNNRLSRLVHAPKLHFCDTGLICALLGMDSKALYTDRTLMGQVMETFVFQELQRQSGRSETPTNRRG